MMTRLVYLSLGTNLGDRMDNLKRAVCELERQLAATITLSGVYETAPWGYEQQPFFLNMCAKLKSDKSPEELLAVVKGIEQRMGRQESFRWGPRLIDIDILKVGKLRRNRQGLEIPHPKMWQRAFVIIPLAEIAPNIKEPGGRRIAEVSLEMGLRSGISRLGLLK